MSDDTNAFRLGHEQTVRTIAETHRALIQHCSDTAAITVDPTDVVEADLTLVQLIESLRRTGEREGKRVCIKGPLPVCLRDVLVRGGFLTAPDSHLFWTSP